MRPFNPVDGCCLRSRGAARDARTGGWRPLPSPAKAASHDLDGSYVLFRGGPCPCLARDPLQADATIAGSLEGGPLSWRSRPLHRMLRCMGRGGHRRVIPPPAMSASIFHEVDVEVSSRAASS
jgi:hypothetical protein